jgi:hypothetical protein
MVTLSCVHLTHQFCSSLGAPIRHDLVIEFTSTLIKSAGDPKSGKCGCEHGCDFSPVGVTMSRFGQVPRVWPRAGFYETHPKPAPLPSLIPPLLSRATPKIHPPLIHNFSHLLKGMIEERIVFCLFIGVVVLQCSDAHEQHWWKREEPWCLFQVETLPHDGVRGSTNA